jgi:hypothetical protein
MQPYVFNAKYFSLFSKVPHGLVFSDNFMLSAMEGIIGTGPLNADSGEYGRTLWLFLAII